MIKINLSPLRRPRTTNRGQVFLIAALVVWAIFLLGGWWFVHRPVSSQSESLQAAVTNLDRENRQRREELKGYADLKKSIAEAEARASVVESLNKARAVPAHMLYEMGLMLTPNKLPSMTEKTRQRIEQGLVRELALEWDPSNVWITKFEEEGGRFTLEGGAKADTDMTQLALRMQLSVYFQNVIPRGGSEVSDKDSGNVYYKFTITGEVAY